MSDSNKTHTFTNLLNCMIMFLHFIMLNIWLKRCKKCKNESYLSEWGILFIGLLLVDPVVKEDFTNSIFYKGIAHACSALNPFLYNCGTFAHIKVSI